MHQNIYAHSYLSTCLYLTPIGRFRNAGVNRVKQFVDFGG